MSEHDFDPFKLVAEARQIGMDRAAAKAEFNFLADTSKSLLAKLALDADAKSIAEGKERALASQEYRDHLAGVKEAELEYERLNVRWVLAQKYMDLVQTQQANVREEMRLAGRAG